MYTIRGVDHSDAWVGQVGRLDGEPDLTALVDDRQPDRGGRLALRGDPLVQRVRERRPDQQGTVGLAHHLLHAVEHRVGAVRTKAFPEHEKLRSGVRGQRQPAARAPRR